MRPAGRQESLYFNYPRFAAGHAPELNPELDGNPLRHQVVIAGAGPIGMTAALTLARYGVATVLLDRKDTFNDGSRAICIARPSMHILARIGAIAPNFEWNAPDAKWFVDGKINASANCLDRHVRTARRNKAAFIWEGEPGDRRTLTYWDLFRQVNQFANVLTKHGHQVLTAACGTDGSRNIRTTWSSASALRNGATSSRAAAPVFPVEAPPMSANSTVAGVCFVGLKRAVS